MIKVDIWLLDKLFNDLRTIYSMDILPKNKPVDVFYNNIINDISAANDTSIKYTGLFIDTIHHWKCYKTLYVCFGKNGNWVTVEVVDDDYNIMMDFTHLDEKEYLHKLCQNLKYKL